MEIVVRSGKYAIETDAQGKDEAGLPVSGKAVLGVYKTKAEADEALAKFKGEKEGVKEPEETVEFVEIEDELDEDE